MPGRASAADLSAGVGGGTGGADPAAMTVVFDAGQNSAANFEHLRASGLHHVGSIPPSDCPDLLALPASRRRPMDKTRFPGLTAIDTHRDVYGQQRRVVLTHSQNLHDDQARSFTDTTLAKVGRKLDDLAATQARRKPAAPGTRSPPKSRRSPTTPGSAKSSTSTWPATPRPTTAWPGASTPPIGKRWKPGCSANGS